MESAFAVLNTLETEGVIQRYAVGGAFALLFYAEPSLTYDVDVFVFLPQAGPLISLNPTYRHLESKGYQPDKKHVIIDGVPIQFISAYNPLVEEALRAAVEMDYKGIQVRVLKLEYLIAIMLYTNRPKDRARVEQIRAETPYDHTLLQQLLKRHDLKKRWEALNEAGS